MAEASLDSERLYHFSYEFRGSRWGFEIPATSEAEAKARLSKIATAHYDGQVIAKVGFAAGPISRFFGKLGL